MTESKSKALAGARNTPTADSVAGLRKPYQAPAIEESAQFETLALSCAKQDEVSACLGGSAFNS